MKFAGIAARSPIGKFFSLSQSSDAHRPEAAQPIDPTKTTTAGASDSRWLWRGYVFILAFLALRLWYAASGFIELSEDEAYQWLWSKHLALSYYSKPPMIAYTQFLATSIWGDTEFGIRFFSPVIAAIVMFLMLR
ncbi:MAG: glycosyl transferase family 39, partial [Pedosphaera sp.]|nr:glycosyl transferase family 39 [Pedosphaera sp.]